MEQSNAPPEMAAPAPAPAPAPEQPAAPMTKSALKRQRRQDAWQANKLARRAAEKDKRKQKQQEIRDLVQRGLIEKPTDTPSHRKKQKQKELAKDKVPHPARICIDLDFDKLMSDKVTRWLCLSLSVRALTPGWAHRKSNPWRPNSPTATRPTDSVPTPSPS